MIIEVKDRWEHTSAEFQKTADVSIQINWGWDDVDDEALLGDIDGQEVLELGCGGGQDTVALTERGASVTGIDLTRQQLHHAVDLFDERGLEIDVIEGDITNLPFVADQFDLAFNTWVFQWVPDISACFSETIVSSGQGGGSSSRCHTRFLTSPTLTRTKSSRVTSTPVGR